MTLAIPINPSTSIRPLGEEHLRMFRRMVQEREAVPRVTLPEESKAKVMLSNTEVTYKDDAESTARKLGGRLATLKEFCMDEALIKASRRGWVFIGWEGAPKEMGWYHVDRKREILIKITESESRDLEWHERLYVNQSALDAIEGERPLAAYVYFGYGGGYRVNVDSVIWGGVRAQVAYVKDEK